MWRIYITSHFKKQLKPHIRKHKKLKNDVIRVLSVFSETEHVKLGSSVFKIRLRSTDLPRGKSKSYRMIIYVVNEDNLLVPLAIYFKGNKDTLTKKQISYHLAMTLLELDVK